MMTRNWATEHDAGRWHFLSSNPEQSRLSVVACLAALYGRDTIVDFGCAQGCLRRWLNRERFAKYVGVDIAAEAFEFAEEFSIESDWIESDVESYIPPRAIPDAAIVFSEILYYVEQPVSHIVRISEVIQPGCMIVSITDPQEKYAAYKDRVDAIWKGIDELDWIQLASIELTDRLASESWRIVALRPS